MKKRLKIYTLFGLMILAASCSVTRPYQVPVAKMQDLYRDQSSTDTTNFASLHWTEVFNDTLLRNLIQEGISNNLDLKIAYSRILQAQAYYEQSRLAFLPNISSEGNSFTGKQSNSKTA